MFTGIIHKTARVARVVDQDGNRRLTLITPWRDHVLGESIAVNGVCLTVAAIRADQIDFDIISQTLAKTNLAALKVDEMVHTERALRVGDPLDGHMVQGHVDDVGRLLHVTQTPSEFRMRIEAPKAMARYLIPQGSIAIEGVSLTLAKVEDNVFEVALIPTTLSLTTLAKKSQGCFLNLEFDQTAKTIISYLERMGR